MKNTDMIDILGYIDSLGNGPFDEIQKHSFIEQKIKELREDEKTKIINEWAKIDVVTED